MICPSCMNDVMDGSIMCPICGEPIERMPSYSGPSYMDLQPVKKKTNVTAIMILIIAIAVISIGGIIAYNVINKKDSANSTAFLRFLLNISYCQLTPTTVLDFLHAQIVSPSVRCTSRLNIFAIRTSSVRKSA